MSTDAPEELFSEDDGVLYAEQVVPQHGILGFTLRELLIVIAWALMLVVSFFPLYAELGSGTIWNQGISWLLPVGLPTAAAFLLVLRRFSPEGIRRVGSLGVDQFASVAFAVAAVYWADRTWVMLSAVLLPGDYVFSWVVIAELVLALALVLLTVFAPFIPGIRDDFRGRLITLAHSNANPARPVARHTRPEPAAVAAASVGPGDEEPADRTRENTIITDDYEDEDDEADAVIAELVDDIDVDEITHEREEPAASISLTDHAAGGEPGSSPQLDDDYVPGYARTATDQADAPEPDRFQPFWALAPTERDVFDERGEPLFRIGPDAWALVIEDRGGAYVVRHDDGRIGFLHDIADITKG